MLCSAYADDMAILVRSQHAMDVALQRCQQWADRRFVRFSPKKTKLMRLAQGNEATRATTALAGSLYGVALEVVDSFVYLGVTLHAHRLPKCCPPEKVVKAEARATQLRGLMASFGVRTGVLLSVAKVLPLLLFGCELLPVHQRANTVFGQLLRAILRTFRTTHSWLVYSELGMVRPTTIELAWTVNGVARFVAGRSNLGHTLAAALAAQLGLDRPDGDNEPAVEHQAARDTCATLTALRGGVYMTRVFAAIDKLNEHEPSLRHALGKLCVERLGIINVHCLTYGQEQHLEPMRALVDRLVRSAVVKHERAWQVAEARNDTVLRQFSSSLHFPTLGTPQAGAQCVRLRRAQRGEVQRAGELAQHRVLVRLG